MRLRNQLILIYLSKIYEKEFEGVELGTTFCQKNVHFCNLFWSKLGLKFEF